MTRVRFLNPDGSLAAEGEADDGSVLDLGQALGMTLEGTCEAAMACSTCHVLVSEKDYRNLPEPSPHEEDMLDFTAHVGPTSRLGCQIELGGDLQELEVTLPAEHNDMSN